MESIHLSDKDASLLLLGGIVVYAIPLLITLWILVRKAGRAGWTQLIPFYSYFVLGEIAQRPRLATVAIAINILSTMFSFTSAVALNNVFGVLSLISYIALLVAFSRQYSSGAGKWFIFLLLPIVGVFLTRKTLYTGDATEKNIH